jgi:hypothetical protein
MTTRARLAGSGFHPLRRVLAIIAVASVAIMGPSLGAARADDLLGSQAEARFHLPADHLAADHLAAVQALLQAVQLDPTAGTPPAPPLPRKVARTLNRDLARALAFAQSVLDEIAAVAPSDAHRWPRVTSPRYPTASRRHSEVGPFR